MLCTLRHVVSCEFEILQHVKLLPCEFGSMWLLVMQHVRSVLLPELFG